MHGRDEGFRVEMGRDIGYDFARIGLDIPEDAPDPVKEGFREGMHTHGCRRERATQWQRKLVRLKLSAYRRSRVVDGLVTAEYLERISVKVCPITRIELTSGTDSDSDGTIDRVFNGGAYAAGNLAMMSRRANQAKGSLLPEELLEIAAKGMDHKGLTSLEWRRLACLSHMAAPPGYPRSHLPLLVLPPVGLLIGSGINLLQITCTALAAGWISKAVIQDLRDGIHGKAGKKQLGLFMEALIGQVSRELAGCRTQDEQRLRAGDCWGNELVFGRFLKFLAAMSKEEAMNLIQRCQRAHRNLAPLQDEALEGWRLETGGYEC